MSRLEIDPGDRPDHMPPPQARRPARFGGIAKAVSAAVAVAALAWGVRYGSDYFTAPPTPSGPVPVIGPDAGPVKVVPDNPGGVNVPDQDKVILNGDNAQPKVEQLLPEPEKPLAAPPPAAAATPPPAAPVPAPQAAAPTPPVAAPGQPVQLVPPPAPPQPAQGNAPAPKPQPAAPPVAAAPPAKPAVSPPVAAATPVAPPPAQTLPPGSGYFLQLGAVRTTDAAQQSWTKLKTAQPDILGNLPANAVRVDLGADRGVFFRIMAGPIADEASATRSCNALKQRNVACILVKP